MGIYDGLQEVPASATVGARPPPPPPSMYDGLELAPVQPGEPRTAAGAWEAVQAGFQGSVPGLAWRGRLPELVINPEHSKWWERAISGITAVGSEIPLFAVGMAAGAPAGAAVGGAITGPAAPAGAAIGGILGAGAGMFAVPGAIRESLIQAYKSGEIKTAAEWFNIVREVASATAKEALVGASTFGVGGIAARTVGKAIAPSIGQTITTGTAVKAIGAADVAGQIAGMVTMPAALQGRLPDAIEFMDAAIVIGGLKLAHPIAKRMATVFEKTGKTPAEQVADIQEGRVSKEEFIGPPEPPTDPAELRSLLVTRLTELTEKLEGTPDRTVTGPDDQPMVIRGRQREIMSDAERRELAFLKANIDNPEALADTYRIRRTGAEPTVSRETPLPWPDPIKVQEQLFTEVARRRDLEGTVPVVTPEATTLIREVDRGNAPAGMTEDLRRIATDNGIEVTDATTPKTVVDAIRAKMSDQDTLISRMTEEQALEHARLTAKITALQADLTRLQAFETSTERVRASLTRQLKMADEARERNEVYRLTGREPDALQTPRYAPDIVELVVTKIVQRAKRLGKTPDEVYGEYVQLKSGFWMPDARLDSPPHRAALEEIARARRTSMPPAPGKIASLIGDMKALGGINLEHMKDVTGDNKLTKGVPIGLFNKRGLGLDELVTQLKERGWDINAEDVDGGVQQLRDMIRAEINEPGANVRLGDEAQIGARNERELAAYEIQAINKALAGERMADQEEAIVRQYLDEHDAMAKLGPEGYGSAKAAVGTERELTAKDVLDTDAVERAIAIDPDAVEQAATRFEGDDAGFMAEIRRILGEPSPGIVESSEAAARSAAAAAAEAAAARAAIERDGSEELRAAVAAGELTPDAALAISAAAPGNEALQAIGRRVVSEGNSTLFAVNLMKAAEIVRGEKPALDPAGIAEAEQLAGAATKHQMWLAKAIETETDTWKKADLQWEQHAWDSWPSKPELIAKLRDPNILHQDAFELQPETPAELKARDEEATVQAKRKLIEERNAERAAKGLAPVVDQADLFNTQGTLFQSQPGEWYYSELARQIERLPANRVPAEGMSAEQWKKLIWEPETTKRVGIRDEKNRPTGEFKEVVVQGKSPLPGVTRDEINASQVGEWLDAQADMAATAKEWHANFAKAAPVKVDRHYVIAAEGRILTAEGRYADLEKDGPTFPTKKEAQAAIDAKVKAGAPADRVTREQVLDFIKKGGLRVQDVVLGEGKVTWKALTPEESARFDGYQEMTQEQMTPAQRVDYADLDRRTGVITGVVPAEDATKFSQWQLPGGKNYREAFITLPEIPGMASRESLLPEGYRVEPVRHQGVVNWTMIRADGTPVPLTYLLNGAPRDAAVEEAIRVLRHRSLIQKAEAAKGVQNWSDGHGPYDDIKNPIMRYRFNERTDAEGKRTMFLEELQPPTKAEFAKMPEYLQKNWLEMGLKRVMVWAAQNGFDKVSWTTGGQQVERYTNALRKNVDSIEWEKTPEGVQLVGYKGRNVTARIIQENNRWSVYIDGVLVNHFSSYGDADRFAGQQGAYKENKSKVVDTRYAENELSDAIGKAMADRIRNDPGQKGVIEGENLRIDETGMYGLYDRMVPATVNRILKDLKVGGKVGQTEIGIGATTDAVPEFKRFDRHDYDAWGGAEEFGRDDPPLKSIVDVEIDGAKQQVEVVIDKNGIHFLTEDGESDFYTERRQLSASPWHTGRQAMQSIQGAWKDPTSPLWEKLQDVIGGAKSIKPVMKTTVTQMSFDITSELRDKATAGLPLFQKLREEHRAAYSRAEKTITLFKTADRSSIIHELGHDWLEELKQDAERPDAPQQIKDDWKTIRMEFAIPEKGPIPTYQDGPHEQFAKTWERYFAEGRAPSLALKGIFERFRAWMLDIYKSIEKIIGNEIKPEVRDVFDRMLASDEEIAAARELGVPRAYVPEAKAHEMRKIVPGFKDEQLAIQPYADELLPGPGSGQEWNSRVNTGYVNGPMEIKLALQRMAEIDQEDIQARRGGTKGVKSWAESDVQAADMLAEMGKRLDNIVGGKIDYDGLFGAGNRIPHDVMQTAVQRLMIALEKDSERQRDVILEKGEGVTNEQQLSYLQSIVRTRMALSEFLGLRAEAARAQNQLRQMKGEFAAAEQLVTRLAKTDLMFQSAKSPAEIQADIKAQLDAIMLAHFGGKRALDVAKMHKDIKKALREQTAFAKSVTAAGWWEKTIEGWKAWGLLSGPVTHTTNLFGTGTFQVLQTPVDALAATIGMARGAKPGMGETDRAAMSEAIAGIAAYFGAIGDGFKAAQRRFMEDEPTGAKTESYRHANVGRFGAIVRLPYRAMGAEDAMVSAMYYSKAIRQLAMRQAFNENMDPSTREFAKRVQDLIDVPDLTPKDSTKTIGEMAQDIATRMTFNFPLGEKGRALQLFVNKWNLQWMIPFISTPINITKEVARMSPVAPLVGEWRADIAKGGAARDRAIAETVIGTAIMATVFAYASGPNPVISGSGSPDPGKNRGKTGVWQPYSVNPDGTKWFEYARIQPFGTLMGMAADMATVWDHMTEEEKDKVPRLLARAFSNAVTNQTFLQGITNVINAMSDPARFGPRFIQQLAGSMVPNIVRQPTSMADPYVREVNSALDAVKAGIPGFRQEMLTQRDWLGKPIETKERPLGVMPVRVLPVSEDKVRIEAARLDISMAAAPKKTHIGKGTGKLGDVELTPEERDTFEKVGGEMAHKILTNIVNAAGYEQIPDLVKRRIFSKVLTASHQVAAVAALPLDKRIAYIQSISERVAASLEPENQ